jgi:hypothetical protein
LLSEAGWLTCESTDSGARVSDVATFGGLAVNGIGVFSLCSFFLGAVLAAELALGLLDVHPMVNYVQAVGGIY